MSNTTIAATATARRLIARRSTSTAMSATATMTNARSVATLRPDMARYIAAAASAPAAAILRVGSRNASHGQSANPNRKAVKTTPANNPMCRPEIASKCAVFDTRSASSAARSMPERSPVITATANPPTSPGSTVRTRAPIPARHFAMASPAPSSSANRTGTRV